MSDKIKKEYVESAIRFGFWFGIGFQVSVGVLLLCIKILGYVKLI